MLAQARQYTLAHFQPGQLAFFVEHPDELEPSEVDIEALRGKSLELLKDEGYTVDLVSGRSLTFPAVQVDKCYHPQLRDDIRKERDPVVTPRGNSSLLFFNVEGLADDPMVLFSLITTLETSLLGYPKFGQLTLNAVSPNWLVGGAPGDSGSGGPGSWPVPFRGMPDRAPYRLNGLPDIVKSSNQGKGVNVLILDTVPDQEAVDAAYEEWQHKHPLIHSLLRPGGPLHIVPAGAETSKRIENLRVLGHDYEMTDHGLFAAGIVHTIAPCAEIYLIQVLNRYGVGDHESICAGLGQAAQLIENKPGRRFVVNCSFVSGLPLEAGHCCTLHGQPDGCFTDLFADGDRELEKQICDKIREDPQWLERQRLELQHPCELIFTRNSRVVAAAGNDWRPDLGELRPQARYPAALDSVQGVGALPKGRKVGQNNKRLTASYSNRADKPEDIGVTTLGGEPGEGGGVLGLYLGKFPCGEANCTKWAWWAGTSFATPIISGIVAAVLSGQSVPTGDPILDRPAAAQAAIDILNNRNIIQQSMSENNEDVLDVTQG